MNPIWAQFTVKLVAVLAGFLMLWSMILVVRAAGRASPTFTSRGELLMRYSRTIRLGWIFLAFIAPLLFCVPAYFSPPRNPRDWFGLAGIVLLFVVVGGHQFLKTQLVCVIVSGEGITYRSPWRRERAYRWEDIVEVSTYSYTYPFVFRGNDGRKFTISAGLTDVPLLIRVFQMRLDPAVYEKARRGIAWSGMPEELVLREFAKVFHKVLP
jgi:Bacterial PH domain